MLVPDTNFVLVCPFVVFDSLTDFSTSTSAEPVLTTFTSTQHCISDCVRAAEFTDICDAHENMNKIWRYGQKGESRRAIRKAELHASLDEPLELDAFATIMVHRDELMTIAESVNLLCWLVQLFSALRRR